MKKISEKGVSIIEAMVATAIIGIGFVAIFQMVQYSVRSIDVSGERTKATYLSGMLAEDLYSDKNQDISGEKFMDHIAKNPWSLTDCDKIGSSNIPFAKFDKSNAYENKIEKWKFRLSKNSIKCTPKNASSGAGKTFGTGTTDKDIKKLEIFKICDDKCDVTLKQAFDTIYMGRSEVNLMGGTKKKILYFQVK